MKTKITNQEWVKIESDSEAANELLTEVRFKWFVDYLQQKVDEVASTIIENRTKEVREELTVSNTLKKIFVTEKKVQLDELSGQYKLLKRLIEDLHKTANSAKKVRELESQQKLIIEWSKE